MTIKIKLIQFNPTVGDVKSNTDKIIHHYLRSVKKNIDIVIFPELAICGYPPEDLLFHQSFFNQIEKSILKIDKNLSNTKLIFGLPQKIDDKLYNSAILMEKNKENIFYQKKILPNYGVFDEKRYFTEGKNSCIFSHQNIKYALTICEDIWDDKNTIDLKDKADIIINLNGSPYEENKHKDRVKTLKNRIKKIKIPIIYLNQVGGQDELVFDGDSMVFDDKANIVHQMKLFKEDKRTICIDGKKIIKPLTFKNNIYPNFINRLHDALVLSIKDYVKKNNFKKVLIGLSGGIDSAVTLSLAECAIGAKNVEAQLMPSQYTAQMSLDDAIKQADNLSIKYNIIPIINSFDTILSTMSPFFVGKKTDITEENIQARIRAVLIMAMANKFNKLVITTGNKSEMATGYCTLYGDMAGGFAPLKDVYKKDVYRLAKYINHRVEIIPHRVIIRPPSAELSPEQKDEDSLPKYDILDIILENFIEKNQSSLQVIKQGFDKKLVNRIMSLILKNEHKRRQSPPGPKISHRAFGRERRYPITQKIDLNQF
ncbi:MAG: NAD+ synthase [Gammaproteobacteria bacterium]|nr:MAG: NAD+ synthase [Gammaproteobacteria bacterium]